MENEKRKMENNNKKEFRQFEDMKVWQDARNLTRSIYDICNTGKLQKDYGLRDQIQRSAVSIMSNIAEGHERNSSKEFIVFLGYAKGSVGELRAQIYVALDVGYIPKEDFALLSSQCIEISSQLSKFIGY